MEIKSCNCGLFVPFSFTTYVLGLCGCHTLMCVHCGRKVVRPTQKMLISAWNRKVDVCS